MLPLLPLSLLAQPKIAAVVSAADFGAGVTFGALGTIFGSGLSDANNPAKTIPYPLKLGTTELFMCLPGARSAPVVTDAGCEPLGMTFAGPSQINFLIPAALPQKPGWGGDTFSVVARVNGVLDQDAGTVTKTNQLFGLSQQHPRIFSEGFDCLIDSRYKDANNNCGLTFTVPAVGIMAATRGAVTDASGNVLSSLNPARIGRYYTIWLTGLGPFNGNKPASPVDMSLANLPVNGYSGTSFTPVAFSYLGPSPQYLGLYQANFQMPSAVADGTGIGGYALPFPCGDYKWEIQVDIGQAFFPGTTLANMVQIPVVVLSGDVPNCAK